MSSESPSLSTMSDNSGSISQPEAQSTELPPSPKTPTSEPEAHSTTSQSPSSLKISSIPVATGHSEAQNISSESPSSLKILSDLTASSDPKSQNTTSGSPSSLETSSIPAATNQPETQGILSESQPLSEIPSIPVPTTELKLHNTFPESPSSPKLSSNTAPTSQSQTQGTLPELPSSSKTSSNPHPSGEPKEHGGDSESMISGADPASTTSGPIAGPSFTGITLTSFELFPRLPIELRLKIWRAVPQMTRIFKADRKQTPKGWIGMFLAYEFPDYESTTHGRFLEKPSPVPACLHVNRESRKEVIKKFKLSPKRIGRTTLDDRGCFLPTLGLYFNLLQDIVWVPYIGSIKHASNARFASGEDDDNGSAEPPEANRTVDFTFTLKLATRASVFGRIISDRDFAFGMRTFSNLKELILVEEPMIGGRGKPEGLTRAKFRSDEITATKSTEEKVVVTRKHMEMRDKVLGEMVEKIRAKMEKGNLDWAFPTVSLISHEKFWNPYNFNRYPERCFADEL